MKVTFISVSLNRLWTYHLASYIHTVSYMPPHNQISIWCQGGLRFGVFSFVNTTCQFSLLFTRRVTLVQAWNVILRRANLCTEHIWVCPPGKAGMNNLRSPKSEGVVMHKTRGQETAKQSCKINGAAFKWFYPHLMLGGGRILLH